VLVGDSHADHWVPGLVSAARATGVRLIVRTANGCPAIDVPTVQFLQLAGGGDCEAFRRGTRTVLQTVRPDAVVVSESIYAGRLASPGGSRVGATGEVSTWRRALRGYVASMRAAGIQVGLVTSSPHWPFDPLACIGRGGSIRECEVSVDRATTGVKPFRDIELALGTEGAATLFDVIPELCGPARCRLEVDGHLVYRDTSHLTATYAEHEAPQLAEFLTRLRAR
jgi:hypothetical protein